MSAPTRKCWGCSREVAEPATLCDACSPRIPAVAEPAATPAAAPQSPVAGLSRRDWMLVLVGAAAAGIVTIGLLMSRAVASPEAASAGAASRAPLSAAAAAPVVSPKWSADNRARWVGDARKAAAFDLAADNRVQVWTRHVQPVLVVRCESNAIEVFVYTQSAAKIEPDTDDHTISYAFDDEAGVSQRWTDSVDHDGLFAPDGATFVDRLLRANTLRFGFTPHNAAPVEARFSVNGLGALIEPVAAHCGHQAAQPGPPSTPTPAMTQGSAPRR